MTTTQLAAGTIVRITSRENLVGKVVEFLPASGPESNFGMGDLYLIDVDGHGRTCYQTPAQVEQLAAGNTVDGMWIVIRLTEGGADLQDDEGNVVELFETKDELYYVTLV